MNRTVKGMVAVGITTTLLWGGLTYNDLQGKIGNATKELNRLEHKTKRQNADNILLQKNNIKIQEVNEKLVEDNYRLNDLNTKLDNEVKNLKKNYINVEASAYIAKCTEGCTGRTYTGVNVTNTVYHNGRRVIATDPRVIPMNSILELHFKDGTIVPAIAIDTGGAIIGHKIDVLVNSTEEALKFGRQEVTIHIIKRG